MLSVYLTFHHTPYIFSSKGSSKKARSSPAQDLLGLREEMKSVWASHLGSAAVESLSFGGRSVLSFFVSRIPGLQSFPLFCRPRFGAKASTECPLAGDLPIGTPEGLSTIRVLYVFV